MNSIRSRCYIFLFLTITFFISTQEMSYATDTIYASQIFRDNDDTIVSTDGTFELGFFSPGDSNNRYVGIWYKKVAVMTVVWVANRDNPLTDRSGALRVVEPGLLVLLNHTNGIIWSTNTSSRVHTPVAQLLDSGNLVVRDANDDNPESFLWQSFNYPTDTLLPGMKLGWNFRTGLEVYITSSKSSDELASGDFTFHCDPTGYPQGVLKNGTSVLYKTGPWNGLRFSGLQNLKKNNIFTFGMVISNNDAYYHYEALNDSVYTMLTLSESGDKQILIWDDQTKSWTIYITRPADYCDTYNVCGPYGSCNIKNSPACGCLKEFKPKDPQNWDREVWLKGCIRGTPLNCQKGDAFLKYSGIKLPDTQHSWYNNGMTLEECKVQCLLNCSCMAYASLDISRGGGNGCLLWFGDLVDIKEIYPGQDIYIRMASSESDSERRKREILISRDSRRRTREIIIMTLSLVIGIPLLSLSLLLCTRQRKKLHHQQQRTGRLRLNYVGNNHDESHGDLELPLFDLSKITKATDNFSINNKLGQGGFGPVYKGLLEEGQEIAVKCLSRTSRQGVDEFKNEVISVAKLQHRNLVKLLGWCIQGEEMMLVYEYMVNKSLDLILFDPTTSILLDWPRRFNIINGIARGLMYLHQDSRLRVIHRDLKASNILLDSEMNPKISDFGLARILRGNETEANTNRIVGTYGYMSPEYAMGGLFSVKSDVFSYGVIVLEIVCGKKNRGFSHRDHLLNLLGHAWVLYREERSLELVDSCLRDSCYLSEVLRSVHIGLLCVQEHPDDRPIMSSVVLMLSNDSVLPEPKHPGFFTRRDILKINGTSASSGTATSQNAMSITLLEAR